MDVPSRYVVARSQLAPDRNRRGRVRGLGRALALASFAFLAACATRPVQVPPTPTPPVKPAPTPIPPPLPVPPPPVNARAAGVALVSPPAVIDEASAARALNAFIISCPALRTKPDKSMLSYPGDWGSVCDAAKTVQPGGAGAFFQSAFDWVQVGAGKAFAT